MDARPHHWFDNEHICLHTWDFAWWRVVVEYISGRVNEPIGPGPDESTGHSLSVLVVTPSPTPHLSPPSSPDRPAFHTPHTLVLMRILAMAVNTVLFSDPFGSEEVTGGRI